MAALDFDAVNSVREGVKYLENKNTDIFFVTLNKSEKDYSPTTCYNDYSVDETHFHWQSQSTTTENSSTGRRYINNQSKILLFVRETKNKNGRAAPYTFLGSCEYVSHEGERPMNILLKMDEPIPARFMMKTNTLIA